MEKRSYKGLTLQLVLFISLLIVGAGAISAQTASITHTVHSSKTAPIVDNTICMIAGSGYVDYNIELNESVREIKESYWIVNGQRNEAAYTLEGSNVRFNPYRFTPEAAGSFSAPAAYIVYVPQHEEGVIPDDVIVEVSGTPVTVYADPSTSLKVDPAPVVFENTPMSFRVESAGGNPDGWEYSFSGSESATGNQAFASANLSFNSQAPSVVIKNVAPDGSSLWLNENKSFGVTVYSTPEVTLVTPERTEYIPGEIINLRATVQGGDPSAWTYSWTVNGTVAGGNTPTFNYTTVNTGSTAAGNVIELTATNSPSGIDSPKVIKQSFSFTTFPTPSFSGLSEHPTAAFSNDELNVKFSVSGGNPDGWKYTLSENGVAIRTSDIVPGQEQTLNLGVGNVSSAYSSVYTVEVVNTYGGLTFGDSGTTTISYYPTPSATISGLAATDYFSGDEIQVYVTPSGGDESSWSYSWTLDGRQTGTNSTTQNFTLTNGGTSVQPVTINCVAVNAPGGIGTPASISLSLVPNVYPLPVVGEISLPFSSVFSGTEIRLEPEISGGDPSAWTFTWYDNNTQISDTGSAHTYTAINNTSTPITHTLRVVAVNTLDSGSKEFEREVTVTVWPSPVADIVTPTPVEYFSGDEVSLSITTQGGDPTAWTYQWSEDGATLSSTSSTLNHTYSNTGTSAVTKTITCVATNAPAGISASQSKTMTYTVTVYPAPALSSLTVPYTSVFNGAEVQLEAKTIGGNPDGWTYEWFDNGTSIGTNITTLNYSALNTGSAPATHRLSVKVSNTIDSGVKEFESEVTVTVWPTPVADIVTPTPVEYFSGDEVSLSITTQGGDPTAWTYQWSEDGATLSSTSSTLNHTYSNTGTSAVTKTITCVATNTPAGISAPQSKTMTYTVTVYPAPVLTNLTLPYTAVFSGTEVKLTANTSGGNPDGWVYEWSDNDTPLVGATSSELIYKAENLNADASVHKLAVKATNTIESGTQELSSDFTITIYPARTATLLTPDVNEWFNDRTFDLSWDITGGAPADRSYSWQIVSPAAEDLGANSQLQYYTVNEGNEGINFTLRAEVTDAPAGIDKPAVTIQEYIFTVYPTPQIATLVSNFSTVFSGSNVDLAATVSGGKISAWNYRWQQNGTPLDGVETLALTRTLNNAGPGMNTEKFILSASNTVGNETVSISKEITVDVWPVPTAEIVSPERIEWFSGENIPMSVSTAGGDPDSWNITWTYRGETYQGAEHTFVPINDTVEASSETIKVTAVNAPENINAPYSVTFEYTFTLYPEPGIHNPVQNGESIFDGENIRMQITAVGGKRDGWSYRWTRDGNPVENNSDVLEQTLTLSGHTAETFKYEVTATNEFEDVSRSFTHTFDVTVWPSPTASLISPERNAWFVEESVPLNVNVDGGDASAWSYQWFIDNELAESSEAAFDFVPASAPTGGKTSIVKVVATNAPEGIANAYTYSAEYSCTVYPRPYITHEAKYDNQVIFGGNQVTVAVEEHDGYPDGWSVSWTRNGEPFGDNSVSLTDSPVNTGTEVMVYTYAIDLVNTLYDTSISMRQEFEVKVWPTPSAEFGNVLPSNVLSGDEITAMVSPTGGDPSRWTYVWYLNGNEVTQAVGRIFTTAALNTGDQSIVNNISVTAKNAPENIDMPYSVELSYDYTVWPAPTSVSIADENITVVSGTQVRIGADIFGGQNGEWTFEWKLNGSPMGNNTSSYYSFAASNNATSVHTDVYTVTITNKVEGEVRYDKSYTYNVDIYPQPVISTAATDFEAYYGNDVNIVLIPLYGYPQGWKYEWSADLPDQESVVYTVPQSSDVDKEYIVTLKVTNGFADEIWLSEDFTFKVHGWSRGEIRANTELQSDYNGNLSTELSTVQTGGYTAGWTYRWSLNGQYLLDGIPSLEVTETNYGDDAEDFHWELEATNTLGGIIGSQTVITFDTRVWPVINAPDNFALSTLNITSGGTVVLSVVPEKATGGYNNQWLYTWTVGGKDLGVNSPTVTYTPQTDKPEMDVTEIPVSMHLVNAGPYGANWFDQVYPTQTLKVFSRPETPTQLLRKGDGSTCTLIAMTELTDAALSMADYRFVFGYTDASGNEVTMPETADRFYRFARDVYNNASLDFWVYAQWHYSNGAVVTSRRRHLSGAIDEFNGTSFDAAGRGDHSTLADVMVNDDDIYIDSRGFKVQLSTPAEATVRILNTAGTVVFNKHYAAADSFYESFACDKLATGVYIVIVEAGDMVKIKKAVIK